MEPEIAHPGILASQSDLILHVEAFLSFYWLTVKGHLASGYGGIKTPSSYPRADFVKFDKECMIVNL